MLSGNYNCCYVQATSTLTKNDSNYVPNLHVETFGLISLHDMVDGLKWLLFPTTPRLLVGYEHTISTRWLQSQIEAVATVLIIFGAHMRSLLIIKVDMFVFIAWSYGFPRMMLTIEFRMVYVYRIHSSISFEHVSLWCTLIFGVTPYHIPLKYRYPIKMSNQIKQV